MSNLPIDNTEVYLANITKALVYFFKDIYVVLIGILTTAVGLLLPIKNIVSLLILFFILDVIFGYWAAKVMRGEKFSVKIVWSQTMPRLLISIVLITAAFLWDKVYDQNIIATYKIVGWFISGVLLVSISQNGYQITRWAVFRRLGILIVDNVKSRTGQDLYKEQ
jgi:hypothetical protein